MAKLVKIGDQWINPDMVRRVFWRIVPGETILEFGDDSDIRSSLPVHEVAAALNGDAPAQTAPPADSIPAAGPWQTGPAPKDGSWLLGQSVEGGKYIARWDRVAFVINGRAMPQEWEPERWAVINEPVEGWK